MPYPSLMYRDLMIYNPLKEVNMKSLSFILGDFEGMTRAEYQRVQELAPVRPLIQVIGEHKAEIDHLQDSLLNIRPEADGLAVGKRLPINCNVFAKENTQQIRSTTLAQVMPFYEANLKYLQDEVPPYLNSGSLPYMQQYYSIDNFDRFRSGLGSRQYYDYDQYLSALKNEEERRYLVKFA